MIRLIWILTFFYKGQSIIWFWYSNKMEKVLKVYRKRSSFKVWSLVCWKMPRIFRWCLGQKTSKKEDVINVQYLTNWLLINYGSIWWKIYLCHEKQTNYLKLIGYISKTCCSCCPELVAVEVKILVAELGMVGPPDNINNIVSSIQTPFNTDSWNNN